MMNGQARTDLFIPSKNHNNTVSRITFLSVKHNVRFQAEDLMNDLIEINVDNLKGFLLDYQFP